MSSEITGGSSDSREQSVTSNSTLQGSGSVVSNPPTLNLPPQGSTQDAGASPAPSVGKSSLPTVDAHSLAAVAQLPPDIDEGVDAWPCTHCAHRHATFSKWAADRETSKRDTALRRARELLMKLPEVKTAFPLDRTRFPISRKYGKRCREVYKTCHSEWQYLHERKPNLKPSDPDMNRPLSPDDFKFFTGGSSPSPSSAESPPIGISPQQTMGSPQAVSCAVAKDVHRRYPIYVSRASSSTSDNVSVRHLQTKARSSSLSSRSDTSAGRIKGLRAASKSVDAKSPGSTSAQYTTKPEKALSDVGKVRDSPNLLQPPPPVVRKKRSSSKTEDGGRMIEKASDEKTEKKGRSARKDKKQRRKPNRWPDCCKAAKCKDASICMCPDYEWITRRGRDRIPQPQCWCEYYEMLREIYQMMQDELNRKKTLLKERKERKALEAEVRCRLLQEEKAKRLKRLRKRKKAQSMATLRIESEGPAAHPKYPSAPWMQKLAREIALSEASFAPPGVRQPASAPQASQKPLVPLETDNQISSVLKELALMLKQDASSKTSTPTKAQKPSLTLSEPVRVEEPAQSPPSRHSTLKEEEAEKVPQLIGGDEVMGTDYIVSGTPVSIPQTPVPTPPQTPPQTPPREVTPPRRVEKSQGIPVQQIPQPKQHQVPTQWQIRGGKNSAAQRAGLQSYGIEPSTQADLINFRMARGPQRDLLQGPNRQPQFNSQVRHARAVLTPPTISPVPVLSADECHSIPSVSATPSLPSPTNTPATGEIVELHPHSSYVGYDVPHISVPRPLKPSEMKPVQPSAFTIVEPSSFPLSGFGDQQRIKLEGSRGETEENAFQLAQPRSLQASVGGDWEIADGQDMRLKEEGMLLPRIVITGEEAYSDTDRDYHHFEPHGDFFYLRNLGEGVKFYRRQIFKGVARKKKRSRGGPR